MSADCGLPRGPRDDHSDPRQRSINQSGSGLEDCEHSALLGRMMSERGVSVAVYLLVVVFAWASWVDINGLWVEVPVLVLRLPEGWALPSYLVMVIQVANAGPLLYAGVRRVWRVREWPAVYVIVGVGAVASVLLACLWDKTSVVAGASHSTALIALAACLALVDCTSSVVFLPYMALFRPEYMTAFYVGEGLSGLLPGLLGLVQGVGGDPTCVNKTVLVYNATLRENITETHLVPVYNPPRFSVSGFFVFLCVMICLSGVAFTLLHFLPSCQREKLPKERGKDAEYSSVRTVLVDRPFVTLLVLTAWANALVNGVLPSTQSYSAMPYGNLAYTLAVRLATIANPLVCFLALFYQVRSVRALCSLSLLASGLAAYQLYLATASPNPPLKGQALGTALVISTQVALTASFSYVKVACASLLHGLGGQRALLWCGVLTQIGSFLGALTTFLVINYAHVFTPQPVCT